MVKLVDMPDLGSGAARRVGSSPIIRTKSPNESLGFFCGFRTRSLSRFIGKDYYPHEKPKRKFGLFLCFLILLCSNQKKASQIEKFFFGIY
jgi:hypothetical protein